jgi:hypothetical protein
MLRKCANPSCSQPFRDLHSGKLFQLETDYMAASARIPRSSRRARLSPKVEHFWLCDLCCNSVTLIFEKGRGLATVPLPLILPKKRASSETWNRPPDSGSVIGGGR